CDVGQRDRIEVVVGERHETESSATQLDDLAHDAVHAALTWLLPVGAPHRAERTMFRAAAHGLYRAPHVSAFRQQIPACGDELFGVHASTLVLRLERALHGMIDHQRPDHVAVAADDGVRAATLMRLMWIQRGVNATVD